MKSAVPGEIVDASGGFEENNGRASGLGFLTGNLSGNTRNFEIVEPADKSAFDALGEEFFEHRLPVVAILIP